MEPPPPRPVSSQSPSPATSSLFQVYLRLRPPPHPHYQTQQEQFLTVEPPPLPPCTDPASTSNDPDSPPTSRPGTSSSLSASNAIDTIEDSIGSRKPTYPPLQQLPPTHITIHPPSDSRKRRPVEKFAFTRVFEENCGQLDIFRGTGVTGVVEGVLKGEGRDGLVATLGVTGSGKSHTILGSKSQRGILQLSLDLLFRSLQKQILHPAQHASLVASLCATDPSEAQIFAAQTFLENVYGCETAGNTRANTPMNTVGDDSSRISLPPEAMISIPPTTQGPRNQWKILSLGDPCNNTLPRQEHRLDPPQKKENHKLKKKNVPVEEIYSPNKARSPFIPSIKNTLAKLRFCGPLQDQTFTPGVHKYQQRRFPPRPILPDLTQSPDISNIAIPIAAKTEFCILVSMYEVYNDRIFDLLSTPTNAKDLRRRHLLFKPTEMSPDRKVVAGLRKVVCGSYEEALMVLETGLTERRVAGTGSNSVSSRSHGFFCVEIKRRTRGGMSSAWSGVTLTIVDLAGSERARNAKTAGATLAEAGKINESLMYLGQCLQMQSDQGHDGNKPTLVPFRQCKLTELLFSNSFPNHHPNYPSSHHTHHRNPQKAIMIVTADPVGDFNATSQILRYSALAREVTVPRIPSVSSTILAGINMNNDSAQRTPSGSSQASPRADETMVDMAFSEIARLHEEVEILNVRLTEEESRRLEAEDNWQRAEDRAEFVEMEVREECWSEMEQKLAEERRRWVAAWGEETDRNEEHLDRKLDILSKSAGIRIFEDTEDKEEYTAQLEDENESLKRKVEALERELQCRSPTKAKNTSAATATMLESKNLTKQPPKLPSLGLGHLSGVRSGDLDTEDLRGSSASTSSFLNTLNGLAAATAAAPSDSSSPSSPSFPMKATSTPATGKKMRKLTARKWDLMDENELEEYGVF